MQCASCGARNDNTSQFCGSCGGALKIKCASCGRDNEPSSRFCGHCSAALKEQLVEAEQYSRGTLQALKDKGGERKQLTVLFADIRDSTSLVDKLDDPELGMQRIDPVLAAMKEAVHRHDGIVNKMQGDGVMALFGAPRSYEDHAVRGCMAALAMQEAVSRLGDKDIHIRVGLHTGEVVVQAVATSTYQTFDAAGANVHLASRLEHLAESDCIYLTAETYRAARQFVEAEPLGTQSVRGIRTPVELYKLKGLRNAPASEVFRRRTRLSQLVGRGDELISLERALADVAKGDGRVAAIVGEAGLGKSRLTFEFAEKCRRQGVQVFETRVLAHGRATPYQPILALLRDFFGVESSQDSDLSRQRVAEKFARYSASEPLQRALLDFLGLGQSAPATAQSDPKTRKLQLLEVVRSLVRSGPSNSASVVIVEDLHWIDPASLEFVETFADALIGSSMLLLVNFRPGFMAQFMQRSHYRQINLSPLADADAKSLLSEACGNDPSLALLSRSIIERSQGNPFFLEELINTLVERGDLEGRWGTYRLKGGVDRIPLPTTIQAVIAARIDRLEEKPKQVLENAAVIGREFPLSVLASITRLPNEELTNALNLLRQAELIFEIPPHEQGRHAFRHPLIQEVAYGTLLRERRRALHGTIAQAIEADKSRAGERAGLLAYHLEQAGEILKAAQQNMQAAIWAGVNDPTEALRSWKKVRELLSNQTRSQAIDYQRMLACGQIINFGWREGISVEEAKLYFEEAKGLAMEAKDVRANALIHAAYGRLLANGGSADEYVAKILEAKAIADTGSDAGVQIALSAVLCHALRHSGKMAAALDVNMETARRAHEIGKFDRRMLGFDVELWLTAMRGQTLVTLGRFDDARPLLDEIVQRQPGEIDVVHHTIPSAAYVEMAWADQDPQLALQHANRALAFASEQTGNPYLRVYAHAFRGIALTIAGQYTSAIEDLTTALRYARLRNAGLENEARMLADAADAHRLAGNLATALQAVTEATGIAQARGTRTVECFAHIVRAEALLDADPEKNHAAAAEDIAQAEILMQATGALIYRSKIAALRARLRTTESSAALTTTAPRNSPTLTRL